MQRLPWETTFPDILCSKKGSVTKLLPMGFEQKVKVRVVRWPLTLCDPMDYTVHGIFQARILEWVAFLFSRGSSRNWTRVSCIAGRFFTSWATREAEYEQEKHAFLDPIFKGKTMLFTGFPGGLDGKGSACNAGDLGSIPELGRSPGEGNGNPLQYSCLGNPMVREAWQATVHGVTRVRHT